LKVLLVSISFFFAIGLQGQIVLKGSIFDSKTNDPIIGANVILASSTSIGTISDWDGSFSFETTEALPLELEISYIGYETQLVSVS